MIIGISGKAVAGKDTLAQMIMALNPRWEQRSFAHKLKVIASILTGIPIEQQLSREGKALLLPGWGMTIGALQQRLGTDAIRMGLREDAWVLALFADYTPHQNWIVTDVRFPNEAQAIKRHGGTLVRINRNVPIDAGRDPEHPSEVALDNFSAWDYVVDNNGTLNNLRRHAAAINYLWGQ